MVKSHKAAAPLLPTGLNVQACCSLISDVKACVLSLTADGEHLLWHHYWLGCGCNLLEFSCHKEPCSSSCSPSNSVLSSKESDRRRSGRRRSVLARLDNSGRKSTPQIPAPTSHPLMVNLWSMVPLHNTHLHACSSVAAVHPHTACTCKLSRLCSAEYSRMLNHTTTCCRQWRLMIYLSRDTRSELFCCLTGCIYGSVLMLHYGCVVWLHTA